MNDEQGGKVMLYRKADKDANNGPLSSLMINWLLTQQLFFGCQSCDDFICINAGRVDLYTGLVVGIVVFSQYFLIT